jgi:serine/threonine-protein phosphatase 2B catalytic subunit
MNKYDEETYDLFIDLFESMPVCALVNNKYFAVHGGISPDLVSVMELDK